MSPLKKTNTVSTIAAVVLFIAMAAYLGFYLLQRTQQALTTSPAVKTTVMETAELTGVAVREETVISSGRSYIFVNAQDGEFVSLGTVLASAMDSEAALERASRKRELENEISHMETLLSGITSADDLSERDEAVRGAVLSITAATATGELSDLDNACVELSTLIFSGGEVSVSEEELQALEFELESLESSSYSDSENILAQEAGIFTTILDGRELLTPDMLSDLSPEKVSQLLSDEGSIPPGAIGKLVTGFRWYFAGIMDSEKAGMLSSGDYVSVSLGRYYGGYISMRVEHVSTASGGQCAVVLSSLYSLADTLAMREADGEIICSEYTGLRVPTKALHVDEDGDSFVYVVSANLIEIKYVQTLYQTDDYYLVEIDSAANSLRAGDEIVVSGKTVYEGMIAG